MLPALILFAVTNGLICCALMVIGLVYIVIRKKTMSAVRSMRRLTCLPTPAAIVPAYIYIWCLYGI